MTLLNDNELNNIKGGGFSLFIGIGSLITFLIGVFDGYVRPIKCK